MLFVIYHSIFGFELIMQTCKIPVFHIFKSRHFFLFIGKFFLARNYLHFTFLNTHELNFIFPLSKKLIDFRGIVEF